MKTIPKVLSVCVAAIGLVTLSTGCAVHQEPVYGAYGTYDGAVYVNEPPPAPMTEAIIASPGPGFVWVGGYWGWAGNRWNWYGGHWTHPPHRGAHWIAPRYYARGNQHVWVHGGWH